MTNKGATPPSASLPPDQERLRLEEVFALSPGVVATLRGPNHVFELVNPRYQELDFGQELVGKTVREVFPEPELAPLIEKLDQVFATGEAYVGNEEPVYLPSTKGGPPEERFFDFVYHPLKDPNGQTFGIVAHGFEVTELVRARKRAEEAAVEVETQAEELQTQAARLEEVQAELESVNRDLKRVNAELSARTEEAERQREQADAVSARLEAVLQQMPSGVAVAEAPSGRMMLINEQLARIWRRPTEVAEEIDPANYPAFHPDGRPLAPEDWPLYRSLTTGEVVIDEEMEILRGDDTRATLSVRSAPIRNAEGQIVAAISISDDISERKRWDQEREFLMEASQMLAQSLDYRKTLEMVARLAVPTIADWCAVDVIEDGTIQRLAVVHKDPSKEQIAREITRRWPTDPEANTGIARVLRTGEPEIYSDITRERLRNSIEDEEYADIIESIDVHSAMLVPMLAQDRVVGAITLIGAESGRRFEESDLVFAQQLASRAALAVDNARLFREAEEAREQAEQARADAEYANRAKSEFLAAMSHELRTPLNAIGGYADLLLLGIRGDLTEHQREDIARIKRSGEHLLTLINDILNFAKLEAGQVQFKIEEVTIDDILHDLEDVVELQVNASGLEYSSERCDRDLVVCADREKARQILLNLVTNAIKHTEPGGRLEIGCEASPKEVRIAVRDTGSGIAADHLDRIFDPFVQLDRRLSSTNHHGVGLGLGISRDLAEGMNGSLAVESTVGEGSTFTLTLPRARTPRAAPSAAKHPSRPPGKRRESRAE